MMNHPQRPGAVAGATLSLKTVNQDAVQHFRNEHAGISGIIVADGLGSHYGSEFGSSIAAQIVADDLRTIGPGDQVDMHALFAKAWKSILEYAVENPAPESLDGQSKDAFGTTLLCAIETNDRIVLGYVGNGAIFHVRGNFNTFPARQLLPWTVLNYLNPHSIEQNGKEVLNRLLSVKAQTHQTEPTVLTLSKDCRCCGDIIVCCTDGIYSHDQTAVGYDDKREIWMHAGSSVPLLLSSLAEFFKGPVSDEALALRLKTLLEDVKARGLMDDDCTAAVLVTAKAVEYQEELHNLKTESSVA